MSNIDKYHIVKLRIKKQISKQDFPNKEKKTIKKTKKKYKLINKKPTITATPSPFRYPAAAPAKPLAITGDMTITVNRMPQALHCEETIGASYAFPNPKAVYWILHHGDGNLIDSKAPFTQVDRSGVPFKFLSGPDRIIHCALWSHG